MGDFGGFAGNQPAVLQEPPPPSPALQGASLLGQALANEAQPQTRPGCGEVVDWRRRRALRVEGASLMARFARFGPGARGE